MVYRSRLLFVVDGNAGEWLSVRAGAPCRDRKNLSTIGNQGSCRGNDSIVLTESGLRRIRSCEVGGDRVCPVGSLASYRVALAIQVGSVIEFLSAAIASYTLDADVHAHRPR